MHAEVSAIEEFTTCCAGKGKWPTIIGSIGFTGKRIWVRESAVAGIS
jgi:hypothetical protein